MPSFTRILDNTLGQLFCDAVRPAPRGQFPNFGPGYEDWYRRNCNREPDPAPPPFEGGQCPVQYDVNVTTESRWNGGPEVNVSNASVRVWGPIDSIRVGNSCDEEARNSLIVKAKSNAGFPQTYITTAGVFGCQTDPGQTFYQTSLTVTSLTVVRVDGQPDNCGSPPPPPIEFPINLPDQTVTYNDNDNNSIDIDIGDISIGFPIEVNGNFRIPISFNINNPEVGFPVDVNVDLDFELDGDGEPRPVTRRRPPGNRRPTENDGDEPEDYSTPDYVDPNPEGEPDDEEPPPEDDCPETRPRPEVQPAVIRAVVVTVLNPGTGVSEIFGVGESDGIPIYAPAVGYIQFRVPINAVQTAWLSDIPVKNARNLIPVPWDGGATDFAFVGRSPDTSVRITPLYGTNEATRRRTGDNPDCD